MPGIISVDAADSMGPVAAELHAMSDFILARVSQTLASEHSLESLVRQLLEMLGMVTHMESTYLTRVDTANRIQQILYARNSAAMQIPEGFSLPWEASLCKCALDEEHYFSNDVPARWPECGAARAKGIQTFFTTPVHLADGSLYGTLCAASSDSHQYSLNGEHVLKLFASLIARYIENESLVAQLSAANAALLAHSYTDALTGLANRRAVYERLDALLLDARARNLTVQVAFIDLDDFKSINDVFGHRTGDRFLIEVGNRLSAAMAEGDIVGRLGGDEFLLARLMPPGAAGADFEALIQQHLRGRYTPGECCIEYAGASAGIIEVSPEDAADAERIVQEADAAMYLKKRARQRAPSLP